MDQLYTDLDQKYVHTDPIRLVKQFEDPRDQEIAAIIMSSLAFGQVQQIHKAGEKIFELMNHSPRLFVDRFSPELAVRQWKNFYYRMVRHTDMLRLLFALQWIRKKFDTLGQWAHSHYREEDEHLGRTWARCVEEIKKIDREKWHWQKSRGVGFTHLLPDPLKKSASKRANLLLRWMVRKDGVDMGLWDKLPADKLIIPVDTHVQRIAYNIGLTDRTDLSLKTAIEITARLRERDPNDPIKYDFALCRLGILKMCPKKRNVEKCMSCPIFQICRL